MKYLSHSSETIEEPFNDICKQAIDLFIKNQKKAFKAGVLRVKDDNSDMLKTQTIFLEDGVSLKRNNSNRIRNNEEFLWIAYNKKEHFIITNLQESIQKKDQPIFKNQDWIKANGFQSTGCFPLLAKGKIVGTFSLYGAEYLFDPKIIEQVEKVADMLASIILNTKLERQRCDIQESLAAQSHIEVKFKKLAEQWKSETWFLSSVKEMSIHPAYQQIIGLGPDVIPLLLRELDQNDEPEHWFWALNAITGENPVAPEQRGILNEMKKAWIEWGKSKSYVN